MIEIYTDGSCYNGRHVGSWVAILFIEGEKIVLSGTATDTTNHRMELTAVIKAIEYVKDKHSSVTNIRIVSDSQYVIGIVDRKEKLMATGFKTKKRKDTRNVDLVKHFLAHEETIHIQFIKIKAHQQPTAEANYNIEADILARKILRDFVKIIDPDKDSNIVWRTK